MAQFRMVYTEFWNDPRVLEEMTPEDKYFYLYLLTNPNTTQIGIYQISKKVISFELGYSIESVNSLMDRFENYHRLIKYNQETRELAIKNWGKYNLKRKGKPMMDCILKELSEVKDSKLIDYVAENILDEDYKKIYLVHGYQALFRSVNESDTNGGTSRGTDGNTNRVTIGGQEEEKEEYKEKDIKDTYVDSGESTSEENTEKRIQTPYNQIVDLYNSTCLSLSKVQSISTKRKKKMKSIWTFSKYDIQIFEKLFTMAEKSDFLSGRVGDWNGCNFDWLMNTNNAIKVLEGNYQNKHDKANAPSYTSTPSKFVNFKQREWDFDELERLEREYITKKLDEGRGG